MTGSSGPTSGNIVIGDAPSVSPMQGATTTVEAVRYSDLLDLGDRLKRVASPSLSAPFAVAGQLVAGAGLGAWASGNDFTSAGVLVCLLGGIVAIAASFAIRAERTESLESIRTHVDRMIALYEHDPNLAALKALYDEIPAPRVPWWQRVRGRS